MARGRWPEPLDATMNEQLAAFVRAKVVECPEPPRKAAITEVLPLVLKARSTRFLSVVMLSMAVGLFALGLVGRPSDGFAAFSFSVLAVAGSTAPLIYARRLTLAIRTGQRALALVESVQYSGPGARDTLDAIENGIARGKWRSPEMGVVDFETDALWAKDLSVGSVLELLVAGKKSSSIFPVGLRSRPSDI